MASLTDRLPFITASSLGRSSSASPSPQQSGAGLRASTSHIRARSSLTKGRRSATSAYRPTEKRGAPACTALALVLAEAAGRRRTSCERARLATENWLANAPFINFYKVYKKQPPILTHPFRPGYCKPIVPNQPFHKYRGASCGSQDLFGKPPCTA